MPEPRSAQCTERPRVLAVDWSGAVHGAERHIWLAEACAGAPSIFRLEAGRDRPALLNHLLDQASRAPRLVIGLDFAFSFPLWFLQYLGIETANDLWARVTAEGETWLSACQPPFWGRPGRRRPPLEGSAWRLTEKAVPRVAGVGPRSVFQIGGAGAVGTGSLRGMPVLHRLSQAGATIWPFQAGGWPVVVEIYPRLLTDRVVKSSASAREAYLARDYPDLAPEPRRDAVLSEDAFDAVVSALVMARSADDLATLPPEPDARLRLEGRIWHPDWRRDAIPA